MSRVGKRPIPIPAEVKINIRGREVEVTGPKGTLRRNFHSDISFEISDNCVIAKRKSDDKFSRSLHGLSRMLVENMIKGVTQGYEKRLTIVGVGYRCQVQDKKLTMQIGFSHPVVYEAPPGIDIKAEKQNTIIVSGIDKELVGETAARLRRTRPPEPYKGRGIRYENEYVRHKVGKKAV